MACISISCVRVRNKGTHMQTKKRNIGMCYNVPLQTKKRNIGKCYNVPTRETSQEVSIVGSVEIGQRAQPQAGG